MQTCSSFKLLQSQFETLFASVVATGRNKGSRSTRGP